MNLTAERYLELVRSGAARLGEQRQTINDLNVFPIPDGDTGDNMYMTISAGASLETPASLGDAADAVSHGMLLGARGNSGVILSRIFAGIAKVLSGWNEADIHLFTEAMSAGVEEAYHAVSQPVEGTILTVLREGVAAAAGASSLEEYFDQMVTAMDLSLQRTPELLDVLKKAGVVDSGGAGLLCIMEGMKAALSGEPVTLLLDSAPKAAKVDFNAFTEDSVLEFGYCTEFLLRLQRAKVDLDTFDEKVISDFLEGEGDSLVFFRDGSIIKVHVHTKDPGRVLSRCREWGEFLTVKVENMTLQHHENHMDERFRRSGKALGTVQVAAGEKFRRILKDLEADEIIEGGQTMNPPVEAFLEAFDRLGADTIFVFPNNPNIILTARQAASMYGKARIEVIPTRTLAEGYYAMANFDASLSADDLVPLLQEAVASVRTGLISKAIRDSGAYRTGDYLGIAGKEILCGNACRTDALASLAEALSASEADILVLFRGDGVPEAEAESLRETLEKTYPHADVVLMDGGQPVYDYILLLC